MKLIIGNIWNSPDTVILIAGNSTLTKDNRLVMGKGSAFELNKKSSIFAYHFGETIKNTCGNYGLYGIMLYPIHSDMVKKITKYFGVFQTKTDWRKKSDLSVIQYSTNILLDYIKNFPTETISMVYPGIEYGGLSEKDILPIISVLPNNVVVYKKGKFNVSN